MLLLRRLACYLGRHAVSRRSVRREGEMLRGVCRRCGRMLVTPVGTDLWHAA